MGALYGFTGPPDEKLLTSIGAELAHRGCLPADQWRSPLATLGYRKPSADQNGARRLAGLYSGQVRSDANRPAAEIAIGLAGYVRCQRHDGSTLRLPDLLERYQKEGLSFVKFLRGAYVMAVVDHDRVHLVRDGAGARSIYYGSCDGRTVFAIEPKGVLAAPGFPRRLRAAALAQYLTFSFTPGAAVMLEDLYELPAGHTVTIRQGVAESPKRYFVFETGHDATPNADSQFWVDRFRRTFQSAVDERMPSNEPVGVFLSGGLDSSVVAAEVVRQSRLPVKTYAIHFGSQYPNELEFAKQVADRLKTVHHEVEISPRGFLPRLRKMIWHLDEPIGDPITAPNFELSAQVVNDVRWAFNGEGGDPCFGGPKNLPMMLHHWYGGIERPPGFRERAYLASYRRGYEEIAYLLAPQWRRQIDHQRDLEDQIRPFLETNSPPTLLEKLLTINIRLKGAHLILPKVERMTGAWGLTPLSPLFDERLIRLALAMPGVMKLHRGVEKVVIKRAYRDELPAAVIDRPKSGMRVPVHYWFQGEMKRYARRILSPRQVRRAGVFDPLRVKQLLDYNIEQREGRYGLRLWMLLTFEIWRRIVIEKEAV